MQAIAPRGKVAHTSAAPKPADCVCRDDSGMKVRSVPPLEHVLSYKNEAVVLKFMDKLSISRKDAETLFQDVLKFLWLAAKFGRIGPTEKIDEGWHIFILFTMDYKKFCYRFFKRFLHHRPHYPTDPPDDGSLAKRAMALRDEHLGTNLGKNWEFTSLPNCREYCKCPCT